MRKDQRLHFTLFMIFTLLLACSLPTGGSGSAPNSASTTDSSSLRATEAALQATQTALGNPQTQPPTATSEQQTAPTTAPPTSAPPTTQAPPSPEPSAQTGLEGVLISYNPQLIQQIEPKLIAAGSAGPYQVPHPRYVRFLLPLEKGIISLVPIHFYELTYDGARSGFERLRNLLSTRSAASADCIPELPLKDFYRDCNHQEFNSNIEYIQFKNGSGVRFITAYAIQDSAPVDNETLLYVFQGATNDGQCYLSIEFKLDHADLPTQGTIPMDAYTDMSGAKLQAYFQSFADLLNQSPEGFTPTLTALDSIIASLSVEQCGVNQ